MIFSISIRKPKFKVFERVWERVNLFNLDRNAVVLVPNSAVMYPHILTWSKSKKWKENNFSYTFQDLHFPLLLQYCYSLQFPFRLAPFPLRLTLGKGGSQTVNKDDIILHWDSWPVTSKPSVLNAVKSMMSWWSESFLFADISQYLTLHKKKPNLVGPKITPYCHLLLIESSPPNRPHREPKMSSKGNL